MVTTRRRDAALRGHRRRLVEVDVFTPPEAEAYLHATLADQPILADGAAELAAELGCLPLALAQAGAYMLDRNLSCTDYRTRWIDRRRSLASLLPEPDGLPDEHHTTVATTWSLSVEQANRLKPAAIARPLLEVASMLDPNGIPADLFTSPAITDLLTARIGREVDTEQTRDGLGCLHRLNLISLDSTSTSASRAARVHALVQRATRDALPAQLRPAVACATAGALLHIWPEIEQDTTLAHVLRANTDALADTAGEHLWEPNGHTVLFHAGNSLGNTGLVTQARDYFHRLHTAATRHLGLDHPDTLSTRHNLATSRGRAGAVVVLEELFTDRLRVLGPDHPDTLTTRNNLARWRGEAGDPAGAAALEELLTDQLRVLDLNHPDTQTTRNNLASLRGEAGDPAGAPVAFEELLTDLLRVLGPDHQSTLATRQNLAFWRDQSSEGSPS